MEIRLAHPDDVEVLTEIERDADLRYADSVHPEMASGETIPRAVLEQAVARRWIIVAAADDRVVGWVLLTRSGDEFCIGQISVWRDAGGRGVGNRLMETVIGSARQMGYRSIVLNTQGDVPWNRPWYEKHGFAVVDPADWTDDMHEITREQIAAGLDWNTRVHMRLVLDA
jgi:4-diphosphocytidyl-2-C-methyl-D-erythritol kinase